jgi:hypothetical protein
MYSGTQPAPAREAPLGNSPARVIGRTKMGTGRGTAAPQELRYINATVAALDPKSLAKGRRTSTVRLLLGVLCVLLVLLGSTLEAAHSHPGHASSHADCALCATAHVSIQIVASLALPVVATLIGTVHRLAAPPLKPSLSVFALFTRPPPFALTLA